MRLPGLRLILPLLVLCGALAVAWLMIASREDLPRKPTEVALPVIEVQRVEPGPVRVSVRSQGTVAPRQETALVSEVSGRIIRVSPRFLVGALVGEGEELLQIDPIDYEVAVSEAKSALASARLTLADATVLRKSASIEDAKARVEAAGQRLRQAEADRGNTIVRAPFAAVVDSRAADLGQYVTVGSPLTRLLGTERVEVRLPVLAADLPFLQPDAGTGPAAVLLEARFGDTTVQWRGRVARIENRVDAQTRVFYLVAAVDAPYDRSVHPQPLVVGLFVKAHIEAGPIAHAVRLPRSALHDGSWVFVVEDERLRRREVGVVRVEDDSVIIDSGLAAGDAVALSRLDLMVEGMPVRVAAGQP
jgi:RND family efflux transporter MFP subunit